MPERFDVVVLGGGSGGYVAAIRSAQLGLRTAVVEEQKVGGTCLHRGCIPTKALLQTAALVDSVRDGARLGVTTGEVSVDYPAASRNRDAVVARLHKGVEFLLRKNRIELIPGRGRLAGPRSVAVEGRDEVEAGAVILATGSRPRSLPGVEVDGRHVLTSDEALRLDHVPRSAVVLGSGAVGVEFASLWRSLGAEVTVVEMLPRLVPLEDHDIGLELQRAFERRGIRCLVGTRLDATSVALSEGGVSMTVAAEDGAEQRLDAEVLLVAVGRRANLEDAGLDSCGIAIDAGFVTVDASMSTNIAGVHAVGDMAGGLQLAHKAMHEGVIAAEAIAGRSPHRLDPRLVSRTTYCSPQIGSLGLSEAEAREAGHEVRCGVMPMRGNARALIWGESEGFCKVVADARSNDVLGVHVIGHEVTELIAGPALGMLLEATPFEMGRAVAPHPTLSEVLGEAALAVSGEAIHV
ncbi:MAG TPA: dihydrolipoyl dehydrogenase [Candidatus Dormibacteraeota bacterium]|nr:dihydrolipoyl dehydrogenase [Candidatus Dormibacteraeota bacterium]